MLAGMTKGRAALRSEADAGSMNCRSLHFGPTAGCPILRAVCEGWDTTNLDTDRRVSHPLQKPQRMGHPSFRGASCRAKQQWRLNRGLALQEIWVDGAPADLLHGHPAMLVSQIHQAQQHWLVHFN